MHEHIEEQLGLPSFYDDIPYLISMKNYWPVIQPVCKMVSVESICEIGSFKGDTSKFLVEELKGIIDKFYIVDPKISDDLKSSMANQKGVVLFEGKSEEFLMSGYSVDMYLIDGDHNYATVKKELELIGNTDFKIMCLHDVSWYCADRDFYYDASDIPRNQECLTNTYLNIDSNDFSDYGFFFEDIHISKDYGKRKGVLHAVQDFMADYPDVYGFFSIPSLYGLGFLWNKQAMTQGQLSLLAKYFDFLNTIKPFLSVLEANRLRLIQEISRQVKEQKEQNMVLKERQEIIEKITITVSWRLTKPLRWFGERIGYSGK